GADACRLKTEEGPGAPATCLNIINNQQHVVLAAQCFQTLQPGFLSNIQSALTLYGLDNNRCRMINTTGWIAQQSVNHLQGISITSVIAAEWHAGNIVQRYAGATAMVLITGRRHSSQRYTMETVGKRHDVAAAFNFTRNL